MPIRNRHRIGSYLMVSDLTGFVHYKEQMVELWNGLWVHHTDLEYRNPQEFVRARRDPKSLRHIRPEAATLEAANFTCPFVGDTNVPTPEGPGTNFPTLGDMKVGSTQCDAFVVY